MNALRPTDRVALIGHGAIAASLVDLLRPTAAVIVGTLTRPGRQTEAAAQLGLPAFDQIDALLAERPTVLVECASQAALAQYGARVLDTGVDLIAASIGALADDSLLERLRHAADLRGARLALPAGALAGIDALAAMRLGGLDRVHYRSRKPPEAWAGTHAETLCDLGRIARATTLFVGDARTATRLFPKNANVAATIALAGLGFAETQVEIVADPEAPGNVHEIEADGRAGSLTLKLIGRPMPDNPKTSALTAMSLARAVGNRAAAIII